MVTTSTKEGLRREIAIQQAIENLARRGITGRAARRLLEREIRRGRL